MVYKKQGYHYLHEFGIDIISDNSIANVNEIILINDIILMKLF